MEDMKRLIFVAISAVFLLLGLALIIGTLMSVNPYDSIAFANVEKLRAAMDEVCFTEQPVDITFTLKQNAPSFTSAIEVLPMWVMRLYGDPKYVVYYEAFPQGEGTGWEVYHVMENRLIVPLPAGYEGKNAEDVANYVRNLVDGWTTYRNEKLEGVIVNNIIIGPQRSDYYLGAQGSNAPALDIGPSDALKSLKEYGDWKEKDDFGNIRGGNNQFAFHNYRALNSFEKTAAKYIPCGENSLCFKTPAGVYRYPLKHCKGIKSVQIIYDATAGGSERTLKKLGLTTAEVGGTGFLAYLGRLKFVKFLLKHPLLSAISSGVIIKQVKDLLVYYVDIKIGDFAIVSPCQLKDVRIQKGNCNEFYYDRSGYIDTQFEPCRRVMTYPLYQYDAQQDGETGAKLREIGSHSACVEKIGPSIHDASRLEGYNPADKCIQVFASTGDGYCWTKDPYKEHTAVGFLFNKVEFMGAVIEAIGLTPIRENTALIIDAATGNKAIVLVPTSRALKSGEKFYSSMDRKWWWGWP